MKAARNNPSESLRNREEETGNFFFCQDKRRVERCLVDAEKKRLVKRSSWKKMSMMRLKGKKTRLEEREKAGA